MRFVRRHWYNIGIILALITGAYLILAWRDMIVLQRLLFLNFIALLIHQFEKYGFPGGFPIIMNMTTLNKNDSPDRYPYNQNSSFVTNVILGWSMYLTPVFFPNVIWLALAPILLIWVQFIIHAFVTNIHFKSIYNPGMCTLVLFHVPVGIYYIFYIHSMNLVGMWDWVFGIAYTAISLVIVFRVLTFRLLADTNSKYPFAKKEIEKFNVAAKLKSKGIIQ